MFFLRQPSDRTVTRFLASSEALPLSYGRVGLVETAGRAIDELVVPIGRGPADFARAHAALLSWQQFALDWVHLYPEGAPVALGTVVAVRVRHLGFWSLNGCRVVQTRDEGADGRRASVTYGTLTNHAESGEERFEVALHPGSGEVTYRIRAVSWPQASLARLGQPLVRRLQARFRRESAEAMVRATRGLSAGLSAPSDPAA
jgi:uncharacterized protein (UPF0548 family)